MRHLPMYGRWSQAHGHKPDYNKHRVQPLSKDGLSESKPKLVTELSMEVVHIHELDLDNLVEVADEGVEDTVDAGLVKGRQ